MLGKLDESRPLFQQVAELLEEAILSGAYGEDTQVPSVADISAEIRINPATALKGVNLLVDRGLLCKRRGLGMFVATGAQSVLLQERRALFYDIYMKPTLDEARKLGLTEADLTEMLHKGVMEQ